MHRLISYVLGQPELRNCLLKKKKKNHKAKHTYIPHKKWGSEISHNAVLGIELGVHKAGSLLLSYIYSL